MRTRFISFLAVKEFSEWCYWKFKKLIEKKLGNSHYKYFFTEYFDLTEDFYAEKTILDIGCGPRGSLEWADMVKERIGLDPLADKYLKIGADEHQMTYVKGYVERLPFSDEYFDLISSFNSLDHVENLRAACEEIIRTLKSDGVFLLVVDIHRLPTLTEPQCMGWDFTQDYFPDFEILEEKRLQNTKTGRIYSNLRLNKEIAKDSSSGVLVAKLRKNIN